MHRLLHKFYACVCDECVVVVRVLSAVFWMVIERDLYLRDSTENCDNRNSMEWQWEADCQ